MSHCEGGVFTPPSCSGQGSCAVLIAAEPGTLICKSYFSVTFLAIPLSDFPRDFFASYKDEYLED